MLVFLKQTDEDDDNELLWAARRVQTEFLHVAGSVRLSGTIVRWLGTWWCHGGGGGGMLDRRLTRSPSIQFVFTTAAWQTKISRTKGAKDARRQQLFNICVRVCGMWQQTSADNALQLNGSSRTFEPQW